MCSIFENVSGILNIWTTLLKGRQSVYNISNKLDKLDQYDEISSEIIKYFKDFDTVAEFSSYFTALFDSHGLTTNIKFSIQTVLEELCEEVVKTISDQQSEDDDIDSTNTEVLEQTKLIKTLEVALPILQKSNKWVTSSTLPTCPIW